MEGCPECSKMSGLTSKFESVEHVKLINRIVDNRGEEWTLYLDGDKVMSVCSGLEPGSMVVNLFGGFGPKNSALVLSVLEYIL